MKTFEVKTGFGYFKDIAGNITSKYDLPIGTHPIKDGYTVYEVADRTAFNAIVIWVDPAIPAPKTFKENLLETLNITEGNLTKLRAL